MKKRIQFLMIFVFLLVFSMGQTRTSFADEVKLRKIESRGLSFTPGKASDQIRLLKDYFRQAGYENVPWGYDYDNRTKELVREFQRKNNLKADGLAGRQTIAAINADIERKNLALALRVPYTEEKAEMLIINKSSNTLYHMKNGEVHRIYPVATGKTPRLTPERKDKLVVKHKNPAWGGGSKGTPVAGGLPNNPLGTRWMGISYGGGGQYGIHGNSNPKSIGTYASLGCIRMFNPDVENLYRLLPIGTPVWIGDEDNLMKYGVTFKYKF